jgi:hypothetical protein
VSAGHAVELPSHTSTMSQAFASARHTVPAEAVLHKPSAVEPAATEQARQSTDPAPHEFSQHTLSVQKLLTHW